MLFLIYVMPAKSLRTPGLEYGQAATSNPAACY